MGGDLTYHQPQRERGGGGEGGRREELTKRETGKAGDDEQVNVYMCTCVYEECFSREARVIPIILPHCYEQLIHC